MDHQIFPSILSPTLASIVNESFATGEAPSKMKQAFIRPLLKKPNFDPNILNNYRSVSNLSFISKLIERIVASSINTYLGETGLAPILQSAYRPLHSTETALLRFHNIIRQVDQRKAVMLVLLDLSAAFDTIDQDCLLNCLQKQFGMKGVALIWLASYVSERSQAVQINPTAASSSTCLQFGVPQWSVVGPVLFTFYTAPLSDIIKVHGMAFYLCADGTQLYISAKPGEELSTKSSMHTCCESVRKWIKQNKLKLNDSKTEVIYFYANHLENQFDFRTFKIGESEINVINEGAVRNLGAYMNSDMSMTTRITKTCRSIHFHLRKIGKIRKFLYNDTSKILVHSLILNKLDYCNSLLLGLSIETMNRLQKMQNKATKLVTRAKARDHVQPILRELHWLPVKERICFKVAITVFKCLNGLGPQYLSEQRP
ncbi:reverse transcriptase-like protein [Elysia marginata]|uniref:Reverse transcriptase-like protein n=1 Tax=Elysia marginata TaxID=1093978 RepID=A0AAV4JP97_9GAST|nr:reverse transcriptase-like protein [Elysia marginata]